MPYKSSARRRPIIEILSWRMVGGSGHWIGPFELLIVAWEKRRAVADRPPAKRILIVSWKINNQRSSKTGRWQMMWRRDFSSQLRSPMSFFFIFAHTSLSFSSRWSMQVVFFFVSVCRKFFSETFVKNRRRRATTRSSEHANFFFFCRSFDTKLSGKMEFIPKKKQQRRKMIGRIQIEP